MPCWSQLRDAGRQDGGMNDRMGGMNDRTGDRMGGMNDRMDRMEDRTDWTEGRMEGMERTEDRMDSQTDQWKDSYQDEQHVGRWTARQINERTATRMNNMLEDDARQAKNKARDWYIVYGIQWIKSVMRAVPVMHWSLVTTVYMSRVNINDDESQFTSMYWDLIN